MLHPEIYGATENLSFIVTLKVAMINNIELLAPGGSEDAALAAVEAGADAVYCGVEGWSFLKANLELSLNSFRRVIDFAHKHGKRIYAVFNTIPMTKDMKRAIKALGHLVDRGLDEVIVADIGSLSAISSAFPNLPVRCSVKFNACSSYSIEALHSLGAACCILPRTLTPEQILEIAKRTSVPLEVFIHGTVPFTREGKCIWSSYTKVSKVREKSGKTTFVGSSHKGGCNTVCRHTWLTYSPSEQKSQLELPSGKINILYALPSLMAHGIRRFKIQGRYLPAETVELLVKFYKNELEKSLNTNSIHDDKTAEQEHIYSEIYSEKIRSFLNIREES